MYKYVKEAFQTAFSKRTPEYKARLQKWRKQPTVVRVEKPTNPVRARELGYRAKKDFIIVRVQLTKGKRARISPKLGRKPGKNVKRVSPGLSLQRLAMQRAKTCYPNLKVVNSYVVGADGQTHFYEVIMRNDFLTSAPKL
jgi:large subunit ribosomal protein L15e